MSYRCGWTADEDAIIQSLVSAEDVTNGKVSWSAVAVELNKAAEERGRSEEPRTGWYICMRAVDAGMHSFYHV